MELNWTLIIVALIGVASGYAGSWARTRIDQPKVESEVAKQWQEMLNVEVEARKKLSILSRELQEMLNNEINARKRLEAEVRKLSYGMDKLIAQLEREGLSPDWRPEDNG